MTGQEFTRRAAVIFRHFPVLRVALPAGREGDCGRVGRWQGGVTEVLFDASLTSGRQVLRVPGPVFPYLDKIGFPCHIRGATATFAERVNGREAVSRACVALGRDLAGLPPLAWE
jgi:hypothetical protein